jgi:uncharacterized protein (DUF1015 family)
MADILPFCGVRYNPSAVNGDLAAVTAPPYDVISPVEQQKLYDRHPNNVVRLILGREEDRYQNAARLFREWIADGTLIVEDRPSIYVYHQTFADPVTGQVAPDRMGLICLLKLEDYSSGKVLPHENTITSHKADRLNLLRASNAQFESIYGLYSDPDRSVESFISEYDDRQPVIEKVDNMIGSTHRIERIGDPRAISVIQELLRDKPVFIADGHHRYETSLNYRREVRAAGNIPDDQPISADYILITLTAFEDEGLLVLPTHRMVNGVDSALLQSLPQSLGELFEVKAVDKNKLEGGIADAAVAGRKAIGIVMPENKSYLATLNAGISEVPSLIPGAGSDALKQLDVTILQQLILNDRLGITPDALAAGGKVTYTRDIREALDAVENGTAQASFILGRPSVEDVRLVSLAGDKMPQKSTFFYPKLLSGLILRDLSADNVVEVLEGE